MRPARFASSDKAYRAGIKEVVEWLKGHSEIEQCDPAVMPYFQAYIWVDLVEWQAKLKEWGIKE